MHTTDNRSSVIDKTIVKPIRKNIEHSTGHSINCARISVEQCSRNTCAVEAHVQWIIVQIVHMCCMCTIIIVHECELKHMHVQWVIVQYSAHVLHVYS